MPDYMPKTDAAFDEWLRIFRENVSAIATPLGVTPALITAVIDAYVAWLAAYVAHQAARNAAYAAADTKDEARDVAQEAVRIVVGMIQKNPDLTNAQRDILGLTVRDSEPTPRGKITVIPYVFLKGTGGGDVEVRVRVEKDRARASMHPLADAVECRYILVPKGEMPPDDPEAMPKTQESKKALFIIHCGAKNAGESFWGFFRWVNLTTPANSGSWSKAIQVVVA